MWWLVACLLRATNFFLYWKPWAINNSTMSEEIWPSKWCFICSCHLSWFAAVYHPDSVAGVATEVETMLFFKTASCCVKGYAISISGIVYLQKAAWLYPCVQQESIAKRVKVFNYELKITGSQLTSVCWHSLDVWQGVELCFLSAFLYMKVSKMFWSYPYIHEGRLTTEVFAPSVSCKKVLETSRPGLKCWNRIFWL